ncbi:MAG: gliding motility-associated ABC transporter substrate-binding protein GldG [Bacteroidota bacterium]|nr:gliding motility-associated ABC transporter substrate-binding protein GldG [Bacteroidota bacterium]
MNQKSNSGKRNKWGWLLVAVVIGGVNFLASTIHKRIDLTDEKRFTISEPVKKLLGNLDGMAEVDVFLKGDMPAGFKNLASAASDMLQEFKEDANGRINIRFLSPDDKVDGTQTTYSDTLASFGLVPINLKIQLKAGEKSQYLYPSALVRYHGKIWPVNLYSGTQAVITPPELNSSEALLEYKFAYALNQLTETHRPMVAYAIGNGEPQGDNVYDLAENVLKKNYTLRLFDLQKEPVIPDTFRLLVVVKPTETFTDQEKLKIDQYVMHGGKVIWFIDRLNAEMDSLQIKNQVIAYARNLNLDDLLFHYGVRINPDLIMDLQSDFLPFDVNGKSQFDFLHWNYFPLFESRQNSVINKNVGLVAGRFVNSIDTVSAPGIKKTIILSSSDNSRTIGTPALISGAENRNAPQDAAFNQKNIPAGVLLEGRFTSLYKNRISRAQMDSLMQFGSPYLSRCTEPNKMIVIADGDIVLNGVYQGKLLPMGVNFYTVGTQYEYQFANREFVENCLEYLVDNAGLSVARAKDYTLRLLDSKKVSAQRTQWQLINLLLPILLVIACGVLYQWWRRKKYTPSARQAR